MVKHLLGKHVIFNKLLNFDLVFLFVDFLSDKAGKAGRGLPVPAPQGRFIRLIDNRHNMYFIF